MFSRTLKNSKDGGGWSLLHRNILKEWIDAKIGMKYTTKGGDGVPGPKVDGQTRTPYFKITNAHGGESELLLFSLDFDGDVESKLKEMNFSMIYFSELSKFNDRKILSVALPSLRMPHLKFEQQQWIADTNPSEDGESSWIYEVWYFERTADYATYVDYNTKRGKPVLKEPEFLNFQKCLQLIEIKPEENPWLDPRQLEEIKTTYAYDAGLYARYVEGKWIYGDGDSSRHFRGFYKPNVHNCGRADFADEAEWELPAPRDTTVELVTGWDLGDTNHAAVILDRYTVNGKNHFVLLDELVSIEQPVSIEDFTTEFMELITDLESQFMKGGVYNLDRAWSDRSSIEKYQATGDTFPYLQVYAATGNRVFLRGVPKAAGSVRIRVQLLKQLLAQNRLKIGAHCAFTIKMLKDLKKGTGRLNYVVPDENKHVFDALTYALLMECSEELIENEGIETAKRTSEKEIAVQVR